MTSVSSSLKQHSPLPGEFGGSGPERAQPGHTITGLRVRVRYPAGTCGGSVLGCDIPRHSRWRPWALDPDVPLGRPLYLRVMVACHVVARRIGRPGRPGAH